MNNVEIIKIKHAENDINILIIEDNENCCSLIKEFLSLFYEVECVKAAAGFNLSQFIKDLNKIRLIIINFRMIERYYYDFIKNIMQDTPVITTTADNSSATMKKIKEYGFRDIMVKPLLAKDLISKVSSFLSQTS